MKNPEIDYLGRYWYNDKDELHREDGPAIEWNDGTKEWFINDKCHREDGPAVEYIEGNKLWFFNDKFIGDSDDGFTQEDFERYLKIKEYW